MAITRAQQAKQMLQNGGMLVSPSKDGKRPGYRSEKFQSARQKSYSAPKSTYSSEIEDEIVTRGDTGDRRETLSTTPRFMPSGGAPKTKEELKDIRDRQRERYQNQFTSKGRVPPGPNQKARQRALNFLNRNASRYLNRFESYYDPSKFSVTKTGYPNFGFPNIYGAVNEELGAAQELRDILKTDNMIPVGKSGRSFEMSAIPDLDIDSIRELAATQTTMQGAPLTGYQANALKDLKEVIEKRDNLLETGDTSGIYPPPPTPAPDDDRPSDPCLGPNPPAYCNIGGDDDDQDQDPKQILSTRILGSQFDPTFFAAEGGMAEENDPVGGIMDLESGRQMYFLGKLVKKVTRGVKKIVKSPLGKAAIGAALFKFGGGGGGLSGLKNFFLKDAAKGFGLSNLSGKGIASIIGGASLLPLLMGPKEDDEFDLEAYYAANRLNPNAPLNTRIGGSQFAFAEGGSTKKEPVATKTMPLLDMDGQEMDLRAEGGFVPIGRMEKADDVPARLSKNEFVFTADAVRNAGDGDVDKGAEVMYNMMKNLESGGEVSEESQGLEGARNMFQTSKRLEEVI